MLVSACRLPVSEATERCHVSGCKYALTLKNPTNLFKGDRNISFWKPYLREPVNIGEFSTPLFQKNNGALKTKPALEEPKLVDNIRARVDRTGMLVFRGHDQEGKVRTVEHCL